MKVIFLHVSIILSARGVSKPIPRGEVEGSGWGEVSRHIPRGEVEGSGGAGSPGLYPGGGGGGLARGVSRTIPKGEVEGSGRGGPRGPYPGEG